MGGMKSVSFLLFAGVTLILCSLLGALVLAGIAMVFFVTAQITFNLDMPLQTIACISTGVAFLVTFGFSAYVFIKKFTALERNEPQPHGSDPVPGRR